jgi:hypothetical protein
MNILGMIPTSAPTETVETLYISAAARHFLSLYPMGLNMRLLIPKLKLGTTIL